MSSQQIAGRIEQIVEIEQSGGLFVCAPIGHQPGHLAGDTFEKLPGRARHERLARVMTRMIPRGRHVERLHASGLGPSDRGRRPFPFAFGLQFSPAAGSSETVFEAAVILARRPARDWSVDQSKARIRVMRCRESCAKSAAAASVLDSRNPMPASALVNLEPLARTPRPAAADHVPAAGQESRFCLRKSAMLRSHPSAWSSPAKTNSATMSSSVRPERWSLSQAS